MIKKKGKIALVTLSGLILALLMVNTAPVHQYITVLKSTSAKVSTKQEDPLRLKIEEWKKTKDEAPVDAYVDRIWKAAVPGYNGREVDVNSSLKNMTDNRIQTEAGLVYNEIPPSVSLEQLGIYPIYRGNPKKPAVSFMVNVAWGNEYLDKILNTLDKYQIKTTFFLDGSWTNKYPELAKKIKDHGHEIGNHAYTHPDMARLGADRIRQEIGKTQTVIEKATGVKPTLFAPPSGAFSDQVVKIAQNEFAMKTIMWTADTVDWQNPSVYTIMQRMEKKLDKGVLVLMHPTASSSQALEQMILLAKKRGLTITTVSQVISSNRLQP